MATPRLLHLAQSARQVLLGSLTKEIDEGQNCIFVQWKDPSELQTK